MFERLFIRPANSEQQEIKINIKRQTVTGKLTLFSFVDNGYHIAYVPALNLTGYGDSIDEANALIDVVMEDYWKSLFSLSEKKVLEELKKLGWKRNPLYNKDFYTEAHVDKEGILRNFNLPAETEIKEQMVGVNG